MSMYGYYWQNQREPREDHEKAWKRSEATKWDARWHALSPRARQAFLTEVKPANKEGSATVPSTLAERIPPGILDELTAAGLVRVEPAAGKKAAKVVALSDAYDFSARVRSMYRYNLLGKADRATLANYIKHAFFNQGESVINRVLADAKVEERCRLEDGLELYVTSKYWPGWAVGSSKAKAAGAVLEAIRKAPGPVPLAGLPGLVKGAKEDDVLAALEGLITSLAVFEDVKPATFDLVVGLLPEVREKLEAADRPRARPPLVACEKPREFGPIGGLMVGDLRAFLLEVAGEPPRLRQDGGIFQKEEPRFLAALGPWPDWIYEALQADEEERVEDVYEHARAFKLVESEVDDRQVWLKLSGRGRKWLAAGIEDQYGTLYEEFRAYANKRDAYSYDYDSSFGDAKFFGIHVGVFEAKKGRPAYYYEYRDIKPEQREALRAEVHRAFQELPVGVYHRWDSVLDHLAFEGHNPLLRVMNPDKAQIFLDQRPVPQLPERREEAGKRLLGGFLRARLLPFDAMKPAVDDQGRLCVARLPRSEGYFGKPFDKGAESGPVATRVIIQPDFSVLVIGLDPAPAAELAPFCERTRGQFGHGAITFRITRDSVVRAVTQGLSGASIVARLRKFASVDVPENVLAEVREWAGWIRLVNVRPMTAVRCPDAEAVARVVSALGRKAERVGDTLVALNVPKLTSVERQKLQDQGIIITKDDITVAATPRPAAEKPTPAAAAPKKRGRPRKIR